MNILSDLDLAAIGSRIREVRQMNHLSQNELSDKAKISAAYIRDIEKGRRSLSIERLNRIACALDVSVDFLLTGKRQSPPCDTEYIRISAQTFQQIRQLVSILSDAFDRMPDDN